MDDENAAVEEQAFLAMEADLDMSMRETRRVLNLDGENYEPNHLHECYDGGAWGSDSIGDIPNAALVTALSRIQDLSIERRVLARDSSNRVCSSQPARYLPLMQDAEYILRCEVSVLCSPLFQD